VYETLPKAVPIILKSSPVIVTPTIIPSSINTVCVNSTVLYVGDYMEDWKSLPEYPDGIAWVTVY